MDDGFYLIYGGCHGSTVKNILFYGVVGVM